jgi:hypothetical protein
MLIGFKGLFSLSIMCLYIYLKMNNVEEMILLINIINIDPSLSLYLSMMPCFILKFAYTNYEFTKYFLLSNLNVKYSNLFYQDLSRYILIIETYSDE